MRYNINGENPISGKTTSKVSRDTSVHPRPDFILELACDCDEFNTIASVVGGGAVLAKFHPFHGLIATC